MMVSETRSFGFNPCFILISFCLRSRASHFLITSVTHFSVSRAIMYSAASEKGLLVMPFFISLIEFNFIFILSPSFWFYIIEHAERFYKFQICCLLFFRLKFLILVIRLINSQQQFDFFYHKQLFFKIIFPYV